MHKEFVSSKNFRWSSEVFIAILYALMLSFIFMDSKQPQNPPKIDLLKIEYLYGTCINTPKHTQMH